jgi:hypothetical protein
MIHVVCMSMINYAQSQIVTNLNTKLTNHWRTHTIAQIIFVILKCKIKSTPISCPFYVPAKFISLHFWTVTLQYFKLLLESIFNRFNLCPELSKLNSSISSNCTSLSRYFFIFDRHCVDDNFLLFLRFDKMYCAESWKKNKE